MSILKFALDEDVAHPVASLLRSRGMDVDSAKELGRLGLSDPQALLRAAEQKQIFVTHNRKDFQALHEAWVVWRLRWANEVERIIGKPVSLSQHAGILVVPQIPIRAVAHIIEAFELHAGPTEDRLFIWSRAGGLFEFNLP